MPASWLRLPVLGEEEKSYVDLLINDDKLIVEVMELGGAFDNKYGQAIRNYQAIQAASKQAVGIPCTECSASQQEMEGRSSQQAGIVLLLPHAFWSTMMARMSEWCPVSRGSRSLGRGKLLKLPPN